MIKVNKYKSIDRGTYPNKEYYINQNGTYISLTKAELEKKAFDLKLLGIADVIKSVCPKCNNTGRRWADDGWNGIDCECKRQTVL